MRKHECIYIRAQTRIQYALSHTVHDSVISIKVKFRMRYLLIKVVNIKNEQEWSEGRSLRNPLSETVVARSNTFYFSIQRSV